MNGKAPHIVQYQGSKRNLASQILDFMPFRFNRLIEPFSGMAAISIAVALDRRTDKFCVNDINAPLVSILEDAVNRPAELLAAYTEVWNEQFCYKDGHIQHFYKVRDMFNDGDTNSANMLYLLARCVKGSVRYGRNGNFNQSPDKRRHGTSPKKLEQSIAGVSQLLKGKAEFHSLDYREILVDAKPGDIVYMDPPYQGVSDTRDNRYYSGVGFDDFVKAVEMLDKNKIDYLISYDGECGGKTYGEPLPESLGGKRFLLNAGISTQATLLGKKSMTFESLYVSHSLLRDKSSCVRQLTFAEATA